MIDIQAEDGESDIRIYRIISPGLSAHSVNKTSHLINAIEDDTEEMEDINSQSSNKKDNFVLSSDSSLSSQEEDSVSLSQNESLNDITLIEKYKSPHSDSWNDSDNLESTPS